MPTTPPNTPEEAQSIPHAAGSLFRKSALSIGRRLAVCFLLIVGSIVAADAVVFWQFSQMVASTRRLSNADQTSIAIVRLRLDVSSFRKNVAALESSHDTKQFSSEAAGFRRSFLHDIEDAQEALSAAPEIAREDPTIPATVEVLKVTLPSQLDTAVQLADAEEWAAVRLRLKTQIEQLIDLSSALVANVDRQAQQERSKAIEDVTSVQKRHSLVLLIAGLLTLLLAVALGWYVTQSITVPLAELGSGAEALARGDFQHEVRVSGNDELAVVGRAFNHAARQLQELYEELREQASLLSLAHDAIYVRDVKGVIRYWNRGAEELYGWPAEYAVGEVAHELLKTVSPLPFEQIEAELLRTDRWQGELVKTKKDGTEIVAESRWSLKRDDRGAPVATLVTSNDITARKRAEETARRSEKELRDVIETVPAMVWSTLPDGSLDFINHRWQELTGLAAEDALGWNWEAVVHPDDHARFVEDWRAALSAGRPLESEVRVRATNGEYRWLLVRNVPLRDELGKIVKWYGTSIDVDERKQAEERMRESEIRFRTFVDHAADAFFVHDEEEPRTIIDVNRRACESLGYTREELIGMVPQDFDPDVNSARLQLIRERIKAGEVCSFEICHRRKDGTTFPAEVRVRSFSQGGRRLIISLARDITDRKRAEEAIRQSEKQLRNVIDTVPVMAFTAWPDGSTEFVNRRWHEYTGLSAEQVGPYRRNTVHPDDVDGHVRKWQASLTTGTPFENEVRHQGADGQYRWFLVRSVPLRDEHGNVLKWFGTLTDINQRKQAEEKLQHENIALREEIDKAQMFEEVVGASPALRSVLSSVSKVAPTDSTVLLTGETGTGKELFARAIHKKSPRSARAFVAVNCAAIPQSLIASELFGHEKGAFTGALQRRLGSFELAEGGTIFLDEVGELPLETQIALLRVLQEREIQRVGGGQPIGVNVRVLAATNRDLHNAIAAGAFRQDLFYRLAVFPIHIPPLRERTEDIPVLVEYFVDRFARKAGKSIRSIEKRALELLESYSWPGNIRELQNVIERAVIVCETETLTIDESWLSVPTSHPQGPTGALGRKSPAEEKELIEKALAEAEGRVSGPSGAAAKLGIPPSTLEYKIRLLKVNKHQFKGYLRES
jgi:PAS domain S-box-containing protein